MKRISPVAFAKKRQTSSKKTRSDILCGFEAAAVVSVSSTGKVYSAGTPSLLQPFLMDSMDWIELDDIRRADEYTESTKNKNKEPATVESPEADTASSSRRVACLEEPLFDVAGEAGLSLEDLCDHNSDHSFIEALEDLCDDNSDHSFIEALDFIDDDDGGSWSSDDMILEDPSWT